MARRACLSLLLAVSFLPALGQQYEGDVEANTLPAVDGASIEFFRIKDSQGQNSTLVVRSLSPPSLTTPFLLTLHLPLTRRTTSPYHQTTTALPFGAS